MVSERGTVICECPLCRGHKKLSLTEFEVHCGGTHKKPAEHTFLVNINLSLRDLGALACRCLGTRYMGPVTLPTPKEHAPSSPGVPAHGPAAAAGARAAAMAQFGDLDGVVGERVPVPEGCCTVCRKELPEGYKELAGAEGLSSKVSGDCGQNAG